MTYEEALKTRDKIREMLKNQAWAEYKYPQSEIKTVKNQNRRSANAEERGVNDEEGS